MIDIEANLSKEFEMVERLMRGEGCGLRSVLLNWRNPSSPPETPKGSTQIVLPVNTSVGGSALNDSCSCRRGVEEIILS